MARQLNRLQVTYKQAKNRDSRDTRIEWLCTTFEENNYIQEKNVLQYEFINLGDKNVYVNNVLIEPVRIAPGVQSFYKWSPPMQQNEFDVTKYYIRFE